MAGQGKTTRRIAKLLQDSGWTVVYVCVPNTAHVGVVPIPVVGGTTEQRYPDILSTQGVTLRLSEVEISLTVDVVAKAVERFREQRTTLSTPSEYFSWRMRVHELLGVRLPEQPTVRCELVVCSSTSKDSEGLRAIVEREGISLVYAENYIP